MQVLVDGTFFARWYIKGCHECEMQRLVSNSVFKHELQSGKCELPVVLMIDCVNEDTVIALPPMETWVAS